MVGGDLCIRSRRCGEFWAAAVVSKVENLGRWHMQVGAREMLVGTSFPSFGIGPKAPAGLLPSFRSSACLGRSTRSEGRKLRKLQTRRGRKKRKRVRRGSGLVGKHAYLVASCHGNAVTSVAPLDRLGATLFSIMQMRTDACHLCRLERMRHLAP